MYRPVALVLVMVVVVVGAVPSKQWAGVRAGTTNTTVLGNRVMNSIVEEAKKKISAKGWDKSKKVQQGEATFPLTVDTNGEVDETFTITNAFIYGLGSLSRARSAILDTATNVVTGVLKVHDASLSAAFTINFPGVGQASQESVTGQITVSATNIFTDIEVNVNSANVPQSIKSYAVQTAHAKIASISGMDSSLSEIHKAGMLKALRGELERTMATNMKVMVNQGIQTLKAM